MTAPSDHVAEAHRRRIADLVQSMESKNPLYVWLAIDRCIEAGIPFPDWVLAYLKRSAGRLKEMMSGAMPAGCGDVAREAEAVGKALGFGAKGRGRGSVFSQRAKGWRDSGCDWAKNSASGSMRTWHTSSAGGSATFSRPLLEPSRKSSASTGASRPSSLSIAPMQSTDLFEFVRGLNCAY